MQFENSGARLDTMTKQFLGNGTLEWLQEKLKAIVSQKSAKELYLTYSLLASKVQKTVLPLEPETDLEQYLLDQGMDTLQLARIALLVQVLEVDRDFFGDKVANLIQVADKTELETFLKFLVLLPHPEDYKMVAVDALRTNIGSVFNAIALHNPYPAAYFSESEWNQMYLKAVFIETRLQDLLEVDQRANADLARIISDYAHERWAAGRAINPLFWRPVAPFLDAKLLADVEKLFQSNDPKEAWVAVLLCQSSPKEGAKELLSRYPKIENEVQSQQMDWAKIATL